MSLYPQDIPSTEKYTNPDAEYINHYWGCPACGRPKYMAEFLNREVVEYGFYASASWSTFRCECGQKYYH